MKSGLIIPKSYYIIESLTFVLKKYFHGLIGIIYPDACAVCGRVLYYNERFLCLNCFVDLPKTGYHKDPDNEVAKLFWGRIPVFNATAWMIFNKKSRFKNIIHEIKYNNQQLLGHYLGKLIGNDLLQSPFVEADCIVPVPLHPYKLKRRGFNQSDLIARGISEILNIPVHSDALVRRENIPSQTSKTRYERWLNVGKSVVANNTDELKYKHILLVDDVITTGATIEACANTLITEVPGISISVAALAFTKLQ